MHKNYSQFLHIPDFGSKDLLIKSGIQLYKGPTLHLLTPEIIKLLNEKAILAKGKIGKNIRQAQKEDLVGVLIDFNIIEEDNDPEAYGYIDFQTQTIVYGSGGWPAILHEICHGIQQQLSIGYPEQKIETLSQESHYEQQCETMAYVLYNALFREKPLPQKAFYSYFSKKHLQALGKHLLEDGIQNDIFTNQPDKKVYYF